MVPRTRKVGAPDRHVENDILDPAHAFLDETSPFGAALSGEDSQRHQALGDPSGPRFAPLANEAEENRPA